MTSAMSTTFVPNSSGVKTIPSATAPGAMFFSGNPSDWKHSFIRRFARRVASSLNGRASNRIGRKNQIKNPNASSLLRIEKWQIPAASRAV